MSLVVYCSLYVRSFIVQLTQLYNGKMVKNVYKKSMFLENYASENIGRREAKKIFSVQIFYKNRNTNSTGSIS